VRDRVRYSLPLGPLGQITAGGWVAKDVAEIFAFRRTQLSSMFPHERPANGQPDHGATGTETPLAWRRSPGAA
jgi:hypothetical protein